MHPFTRSIQEAGRTEAVSIQRIESAANASDARQPIAFYNVLLALRSDSYRSLKPGHQYLAAYAKAGWEIKSLILLDIPSEYDLYAKMGAEVALIQNSTQDVAISKSRNWVFGQARNHFGWA